MRTLLMLCVIIFSTSVTFISCLKKEYNPPPDLTKTDPQLPVNLTIAQLKQHYETITAAEQIDSNWTIYGIITGNDQSGNMYKQITIEDATGGITISIDGTGLYSKLPVGRKVYVKLQGLWYGYYNNLPQIGYSSDGAGGVTRIPQNGLDNYLIRANYPNTLPVTVFNDLSELQTLNKNMLNRLVRINNVEVITADMDKTYAENPQTSSGADITLTDCNGKTIVLRNSAYAGFQSYSLPKGKGSVTALYMVYGETPQLVIRDTADMNLYENRCDGSSQNTTILLYEDFSDLDEWNVQSVTGAQKWSLAQYGNPKPCALMNGYANGTNNMNEDWLISKELDLSGYDKIELQFETAGNYKGDILECYLSANYAGSGLPGAATWALLPAAYDAEEGFVFTPSGIIDLSSYKGQKVHIAFKYTSTGSAAASWELDNVRVTAE